MGRFTVTITPRFSETDMLGHVNNTSVAVWFEEFRVRFMNALVKTGDELPNLELAVVSIGIDYVGETFYGCDVDMCLRSAEIGDSSFTLLCDMFQAGRHVVAAKAVLVQWDSTSRRPERIADRYRERLALFLQKYA